MATVQFWWRITAFSTLTVQRLFWLNIHPHFAYSYVWWLDSQIKTWPPINLYRSQKVLTLNWRTQDQLLGLAGTYRRTIQSKYSLTLSVDNPSLLLPPSHLPVNLRFSTNVKKKKPPQTIVMHSQKHFHMPGREEKYMKENRTKRCTATKILFTWHSETWLRRF